MKKVERKLKEELINNLDVNLEFDTSKLEFNDIKERVEIKKTKKALVPTLSTIGVLAITAAIVIPLLGKTPTLEPIGEENIKIKPNTSFEEEREIVTPKMGRFSKNEIDDLVKERALNLSLLEARNEAYQVYCVEDSFKEAMYNFANLTYNNLDKEENISYSPYGLYSVLNTVQLASNSIVVNNALDSVLGLNLESRKQSFLNSYKTNYYVNDSGTLQVSNASFQTNEYTTNQKYIDDLTSFGIEGYKIDFTNNDDVQIMLDWIDQKVNEKNFISKEDILKHPELTTFVLLSTLYFQNDWLNVYKEIDLGPAFYNNNSEEVIAQFMNHKVLGSYYDYGSYISFKDYFHNGQSIEIYTPKKSSDSIYILTKDVNLFLHDESKKVENVVLDITMPEFSNECFLNLNEMVKKSGLECLYTDNNFTRPFIDLDGGSTITEIIQKNKVAFDPKGVTIKSVTAAIGEKTSSVPHTLDTLEIKLQNPFIYIVYDANNLPLFIGHLDSVQPYNA